LSVEGVGDEVNDSGYIMTIECIYVLKHLAGLSTGKA